jgi:hypothetical protein
MVAKIESSVENYLGKSLQSYFSMIFGRAGLEMAFLSPQGAVSTASSDIRPLGASSSQKGCENRMQHRKLPR